MRKSSYLVLVAILAISGVVTAQKASSSGKSDKGPQFSSSYTDLTVNCKSSDGKESGHVETICKGVGSYRIHYFDSATTLEFRAETLDRSESVNLASQALDYDVKNRKVEWRLANRKPFAIILRTNTYQTVNGLISYPTKKTGEFLIVKGLKGFEQLDRRVEATMPNANKIAREIADNAYSAKTGQFEQIEFMKGAYSARIKGKFKDRDHIVKYVVKAKKGQRMIVNIFPAGRDGPGTAGVIISPSGEQDGQPGGLVFNDVLTETGNYTIRVSQRPTDHKFPAEFIVEVIILPDYISYSTGRRF